MQFSASSPSEEAVSQADGVTEDAANLIIYPVDFNSVEENESRPSAVSDVEGSRYHQSNPRSYRKVDRFTEREYTRSNSDSDDDDTAHHSSGRGEDGPPQKRRRTSQRHDVRPRVPHNTHESEESVRKRAYWAGKAGDDADHSSRRGEDRPPPERRTLQRHDVSPRTPHTIHEREGLKVSSKSARKREYWAGKVGYERAS